MTTGVYWAVGQHVSVASGNAYSDFLIGFERKRTPTYMLHKAVYPTMLCAYFGLCTTLVPSSELEGIVLEHVRAKPSEINTTRAS